MKKEVIKPLVGGIAIGAIALLIVIFWTGWVVTSSKAESQGKQMAPEAVVEALSPICVEQFNQESEKVQKLEELKEISSWKRKDYVEKQGWATMPGEKETDYKVAARCAELIVELAQ